MGEEQDGEGDRKIQWASIYLDVFGQVGKPHEEHCVHEEGEEFDDGVEDAKDYESHQEALALESGEVQMKDSDQETWESLTSNMAP